MRIFFFSAVLYGLFLIACTSDTSKKTTDTNKQTINNPKSPRDTEVDYITSLEKKLYTSDKEFNDATANSIVTIYDSFVTNFPKDSLVPDYLFKLGEVCMALKKSQMGVDYLVRLNKEFPNDKKAMQALFMAAFITDDQLNDDDKAKELYSDFLVKYPTAPMVKDVKACIANLGKSDAELIKEFEKKNKKK